MDPIPILKKLGLSDKEIKVYLALLELGPVSVRKLAKASDINRGTAYDILKSLRSLGLVSYYHKETKQLFVAEDPEKITDVLQEKEESLNQVKKNIVDVIPALKSIYNKSGEKPVVKYYDGKNGIKTILKDVLFTVGQSKDKTYYVFSSSSIRPYMHQAFPDFTDERIKNKIAVHVVAIGHHGTKAKFSERRVLNQKEGLPTYILIYNGKVAMISVNEEKKLLGLIIQDKALFETQLQLFKFIWKVCAE